MRVLCTGASGWVGKYVVRELKNRGCIVLDSLAEEPEAIIHLAWSGLPNYESPFHFSNIPWQREFLKKAVARGVTNITIAGTCLETLEILMPYSEAKLALRALVFELLPTIKWARLWYLYGEDQNENCLLPSLRKAKRNHEKEFSIIDGERDFMEVSVAASRICGIALQAEVTGIIDVCSGVAESVEAFCFRHAPSMKVVKNYPTPYYEPFSFRGDPRKLNSI